MSFEHSYIFLAWLALISIGLVFVALKRSSFDYLPLYLIIFIISLLGARIDTGVDIDEYQSFFAQITELYQIFEFAYPEYGFRALLVVANTLGMSFSSFYFLTIFCSLLLIAFSLKGLGLNSYLFFALYMPKYLFQAHLNQIRSGLIYFIIPYAIKLTLKGKWHHVIIASMVMSQVHFSAILAILIPIVHKIKFGKKIFFAILLIPMIGSIYGLKLFNFLSELSDIRVFQYVHSGFESPGFLSINVIRRLAIFPLVYYALVMRIRNSDDVLALSAKVFLLSWVFYVFFIDIRVISDRIGAFFGVGEYVFLCAFMVVFNRIRDKILFAVFLSLYGCLDLVLRFNAGAI